MSARPRLLCGFPDDTQVRDFGNEPDETDPLVFPSGSKSVVGRDGHLFAHLNERTSPPIFF
jgi:hypothetical protein